MEIYLVGGAVRDKLLGLPVNERDWVVVGAQPETLTALGYRPVGKDFPVFLHPETHEEYALARTERKTAPGYHGFALHAGPDVSLEEDLARRDLTINALAEDTTGGIVDRHGGRQDLERGILRHVSPAFVEDPVRILRVARFAARYARLGFRVADETTTLMRTMVAAGEVDALVAERVWQELVSALAEPTPSVFFETLRACGALEPLFPEIERLYGVPQPPEHHPEVDTGVHTMLVLDQAARLTGDPLVRFAALTHDLGKATTPRAHWPHHRGHERRGVKLVERLCNRLKAPNAYRELATRVARYHLHAHRAAELRAATVLKLLEALDALRRPQRLEHFVLACEADARGREGLEERPYPQAELLRSARAVVAAEETAPLLEAGLRGPEIAQALRKRRIAALQRGRGKS